SSCATGPLTHRPIAHTNERPALFLDRSLTSDGPIAFRVFGPAGGPGFPSTSKLVHLLFDAGGAFEYQRTFGAEESVRTEDIATDLAAPERELVAEDGLRVRAVATHHGDCPSVAY